MCPSTYVCILNKRRITNNLIPFGTRCHLCIMPARSLFVLISPNRSWQHSSCCWDFAGTSIVQFFQIAGRSPQDPVDYPPHAATYDSGGLSKNSEFAKLCPPSERRSPETVISSAMGNSSIACAQHRQLPSLNPNPIIFMRCSWIDSWDPVFLDPSDIKIKWHHGRPAAEVLSYAVNELQMYLPSLASLPPEGSNYVASTVARTCLDLGIKYDKVCWKQYMQYPDALFRSLYLEDTHEDIRVTPHPSPILRYFGVRAAREIALLCRPRFSFHHQHVQGAHAWTIQFSTVPPSWKQPTLRCNLSWQMLTGLAWFTATHDGAWHLHLGMDVAKCHESGRSCDL